MAHVPVRLSLKQLAVLVTVFCLASAFSKTLSILILSITVGVLGLLVCDELLEFKSRKARAVTILVLVVCIIACFLLLGTLVDYAYAT